MKAIGLESANNDARFGFDSAQQVQGVGTNELLPCTLVISACAFGGERTS
jgi:hypothetical protein